MTPRKSKLEVFDFNNCDDCSVNIQFPYADQNLLKRIIFWLLSLIHLLLKTPQLHAMILHIFPFVVVFVNGANHYLIALNIDKLCFREKQYVGCV